ncbi:MAG TPA: type VII secretion protein EccB [Pseudonocardiaceae bacterium]|jgi:type VII secretion protein EccB|nr:type VII secretion protein EccB [Pseudonocardiaceae bacterium]
MPTNPTTKSQVQAYRFLLRRMESALVRKDAVLLHEPMRNHLRASAVGLIVAVLGLAVFFVLGLFKPISKIEGGDIVNVKGTTSVFVVVEDAGDEPMRLVPVLNLTSARLLYAALVPGKQPPETKFVEESALAGIHRTPVIGLPDAPQTLPDPKKLIKGDWSVCDTATVRDDLPNAESRPEVATTAVIGTTLGRPLGAAEALLVAEQRTGATFLVWGGHRLPVQLDDGAVTLAYRLDDVVPRKVSTGLLNAIPEGAALAPPTIPGAGDPAPFRPLTGVRVGDVLRVVLAGEPESFFLVRQHGVQQVAPAVANLIRARLGRTDDVQTFTPAAIAEVPKVVNQQFADFPPQVPTIHRIAAAPVACLAWPGTEQQPVVTVSADGALLAGKGVEVPGATSGQADRVFLELGSGALVRGVVPGQRPDTGQIWLVTEQGLRYGVPSVEVARALGFTEQPTPAPESILRLLKSGPALDPDQALAQFDPEQARPRGGR